MHPFKTLNRSTLLSLLLISSLCCTNCTHKQTHTDPETPALPIYALNYGPYQTNQSPDTVGPTQEQINTDIAQLKDYTSRIRTYNIANHNIGQLVLTAAKQHNISVALGLWLSADTSANTAEINALDQLISDNGSDNILMIIVGNETLLRGDLSTANLISYIQSVKTAHPNIPVTTSEPWHKWDSDLGNAVDFIFPIIHPYYDQLNPEGATDYVFDRVHDLQNTYQKTVIISETGWPSRGATLGGAEPSTANQELVVNAILCQASQENIAVYLFQAFDEPWKSTISEAEGAWGLWTNTREPKSTITQPCKGF